MFVAVAPDKFAVGVGSANRRPPKPVYEQLPLLDALARVYRTDAHLTSYLLPADHALVVSGRQPRLAKTSPADVLAAASFTTIFIDADNPGHAPWTDEIRAAAIAKYSAARLPFGVYHTTGGARFVLPLATPVPVLEAEPLIRRALAELDASGLQVDWSAKDWTRHFRLPNVVRNGRSFTSPYVDFSRMVPVELEPLNVPARAATARQKREPLPPIPFTPTLAEHWQDRARVIGQAIAGSVSAEYHRLYLALGGALLQRQVPPEHVPELVRLAALAASSSKPEHHEKSARDTVARYLAGQTVTGQRDLTLDCPTVADAVHDALADARDIQIRSQTAAVTPPPMSLAETTALLQRTIQQAPDGLTVIAAMCGLGKTFAAQTVAAIRANSRPSTSKRAPLQTKTAISVDKNELAQQIASDLSAAGVPVRRVFGPLSVVDASGKPVCKFHDRALPLVEGGQSIAWEFCIGRGRFLCPYYDTCSAKDGFVDSIPAQATPDDFDEFAPPDPPKPRVTVGTHALLRELDAAAGSTGLLVIDEPPALLETMTILPEDIKLALNNVASFQRDFAEAMTPVLLAMRDWAETPNLTFDDLTDTLERPPTEDAKGKAITRPPMRSDTARVCRADIRLAHIVGAASKTLRAFFRAMTNADATVRLEEEPPRMIVTCPREDLAVVLRREGAAVAMDANADLHMPAFTKVVGYAPPFHRFVADDGARIERTVLRCGSATRRSWLSHGRLVLDTGLLAALRGVAAWAADCATELDRPVSLGIITIRLVELALRAAFGEDVETEWVKAKQNLKTLVEASVEIAAIFATPTIDRPIQLAHYGATRGLNRMASADCLATVGDPWPNVGEVQATSSYLAIEDWEGRLEATARAELEQAHGRLRTVHRTAPGFALHVGRVVPGGPGWEHTASAVSPPVRATSLQGGRPKAGAPMPGDELANAVEGLGGVRAAARLLGCAPSTVHRYLAGRGVPPAVASVLRGLAAMPPSPPRL